MRPIHSNVASVLGMSVTSMAVIYHSPATGSVTGSSLVARHPPRRALFGVEGPCVGAIWGGLGDA